LKQSNVASLARTMSQHFGKFGKFLSQVILCTKTDFYVLNELVYPCKICQSHQICQIHHTKVTILWIQVLAQIEIIWWVLAFAKLVRKEPLLRLRPYPFGFHVKQAGADTKLIQHGPLRFAYHCRHPIFAVPFARITAHATVPSLR